MKLLTPQQLLKRRRKLITDQFASVRAHKSFGKIKTWRDYLRFFYEDGEIEYAYPQQQLDSPLTIKDINEQEGHALVRLEMELNQPANASEQASIIPHEQPPYEFEGVTYQGTKDKSNNEQKGAPFSRVVIDLHSEENKRTDEWSEPFQFKEGVRIKLFTGQTKAARKVIWKIEKEGARGVMVTGMTGIGKTYVMGAIMHHAIEHGWLDGCLSPWPICYITKAPIVLKTIRHFREDFKLDTVHTVHVINVEQLRSKFGKLMLREKTTVRDGEADIEWEFKENLHPRIFIIDECQLAKNDYSEQSKIIQAIHKIKGRCIVIFLSATPFFRVSETKYFMLNLWKKLEGGGQLNELNWPTYAKWIAQPADPTDYSPPAIERLWKNVSDYRVEITGVRPQFRAMNTVSLIHFRNDAEREFYNKAYERFLAEKAKIEEKMGLGRMVGNGGMMILVELLKFRQAAEEIKVPYIVEQMYHEVNHNKRAAVAAFNFKFSIAKAVKLLINEYGVSRDEISLIWGGGQSSMTKERKQKLDTKNKLMANEELMDLLGEADIDLTDLGLSAVSDVKQVLEEGDAERYRLGPQSKEERQREIDRFQSGKSLYCFFTFKSGGVGLSLHHTDELTKEKVRKKESGYAVEEDIPLIPTRQRILLCATTYSGMEMIQGLGRCPRLTSLSHTPQSIILYANTIEERVYYIFMAKLKCGAKISPKDNWTDIFKGEASPDDSKYIEGEETIKQIEDGEYTDINENAPDQEELIEV